MTPPKLFVSYSWTSPDHEAWVLQLATELRESGVDVILDKWDTTSQSIREAESEREQEAGAVSVEQSTRDYLLEIMG